jgi:hypothetical protein
MTERQVDLIEELVDQMIILERHRSIRAESIVIFGTEERIKYIKQQLYGDPTAQTTH